MNGQRRQNGKKNKDITDGTIGTLGRHYRDVFRPLKSHECFYVKGLDGKQGKAVTVFNSLIQRLLQDPAPASAFGRSGAGPKRRNTKTGTAPSPVFFGRVSDLNRGLVQFCSSPHSGQLTSKRSGKGGAERGTSENSFAAKCS